MNNPKKYSHRVFVDLHLGLRTIQLSAKEAQGTILEFGVGMRVDSRRILDYQLY